GFFGRLRAEVAEFLAQPLEDARLGDADGAGAHAQLVGHVPGGAALDGGPPERLPGALGELAADQLQRPPAQAAVGGALGRVVGRARLRGRYERQPSLRLGAADAFRLPAAAAQVVADLAASDGSQPAAEGITGPLAAERADVRRHRPEHLLEDVGGVV